MNYIDLLAKKYPTKEAVRTEILHLKAILALPKGTEFFFSDLHGEHKAFSHLLKSASGIIKNKIDLLFIDMPEQEKAELAHLIYYPERVYDLSYTLEDYRNRFDQLIHLAIYVSDKYTRSKVNRKMPIDYKYIMDELFHCYNRNETYFHSLIDILIQDHLENEMIIVLCTFIQQICVDSIHIIGDIFDRGPRPDRIIDDLIKYQEVDIQWGNHDMSWMGAFLGNQALMCNVLRIALSYNHLDLLEDGYGFNLRALSEFAAKVYKDDPCERFIPHVLDENKYDLVNKGLVAKMHKAITIMELKLDGQLLEKHEDYKGYGWLGHINFNNHTVEYQGKNYPLLDSLFPTIDPQNPLRLSNEEMMVLKTIEASFKHSEKLKKHMHFIFTNGSMYLVRNNNLLFHGCIPLNQDGTFRIIRNYKGKELLDYFNTVVNNAYYLHESPDDFYFLWCEADSPVYGKSKMSIFEKYFIDDPSIMKEVFDPYYDLVNNEEVYKRIFKEFSLTDSGHIINGHVPVKLTKGESPVKANGHVIVIDGGISKAYHSKTGNAGYTLIYDSQHLKLAKHLPYTRDAKYGLACMSATIEDIESYHRVYNHQVDRGKTILNELSELTYLLDCYQNGTIKEKLG